MSWAEAAVVIAIILGPIVGLVALAWVVERGPRQR